MSSTGLPTISCLPSDALWIKVIRIIYCKQDLKIRGGSSLEKSYGMIKIDEYKGRFTLPAKLRDESKLYGAYFEVFANPDSSVITLIKRKEFARQNKCVLCNREILDSNFKEHNGKLVCLECCGVL
jgi:formylmethanofuran dehydrogenase subunit E